MGFSYVGNSKRTNYDLSFSTMINGVKEHAAKDKLYNDEQEVRIAAYNASAAYNQRVIDDAWWILEEQARIYALEHPEPVYTAPVYSYSGGSTGAGGDCGNDFLGSIAQMESGCRDIPNSQGYAPTGYWQFDPGTFAGVCPNCDIHSLADQRRAAEEMLRQGRQCEWEVLHCG